MRRNSGQIVLVILLIMIVGLTIGLAVIARSVTNLKISTQSEESQRAFSAAEAGIESALAGLIAVGTTDELSLGEATYRVKVDDSANYFQDLKEGEGGTAWLAGHDADGNPQLGTAIYTASTIDVCWGPQTLEPALEVALIYKDTAVGKYKVARGAYDPNGGRATNNKFDANFDKAGGYCGQSLQYKKTINFQNDFGLDQLKISSGVIILEALRLKPIYADAQVAVQGTGVSGGILPSQGQEIVSEGKMGTTVRKIKTVRVYQALPEIFDYALFSGTDLCKGGC